MPGPQESPQVEALRARLGIPRVDQIFTDSEGGIHLTPEKALRANAWIEKDRFGRTECQRKLDDDSAGGKGRGWEDR